MPASLDLEIVIVSHGAEELLRRCLHSLREHPASGAMRVTVVDSGSPDSTPDMVAREFPEVRLLRRENIGFSAANNVVLRERRGEGGAAAQPRHRGLRRDPRRLRWRGCTRTQRIGMVGCKLVTESGELDHACKRSFPTPLSALAHFTGIGRDDDAGESLSQYRATAPRRRRARRGRRRQRRLHALPRRGGARGRPARRGLLALHGGPRLVPPLLAGRLEGLLRAGRRRPARQGRLQRQAAARPNRRSPSTAAWVASTAASTRRSTTRWSTRRSTPGSAPSWRRAWRSPPLAAVRRAASRRLRRGSARSCRARRGVGRRPATRPRRQGRPRRCPTRSPGRRCWSTDR